LKLKPNIDDRGAQTRLNASRVVLFLAGAVLFIPDIARWKDLTLFGVLLMAGLTMRFEAKKKWCILRACGIKTSL
jgi:hypothetical protein